MAAWRRCHQGPFSGSRHRLLDAGSMAAPPGRAQDIPQFWYLPYHPVVLGTGPPRAGTTRASAGHGGWLAACCARSARLLSRCSRVASRSARSAPAAWASCWRASDFLRASSADAGDPLVQACRGPGGPAPPSARDPPADDAKRPVELTKRGEPEQHLEQTAEQAIGIRTPTNPPPSPELPPPRLLRRRRRPPPRRPASADRGPGPRFLHGLAQDRYALAPSLRRPPAAPEPRAVVPGTPSPPPAGSQAGPPPPAGAVGYLPRRLKMRGPAPTSANRRSSGVQTSGMNATIRHSRQGSQLTNGLPCSFSAYPRQVASSAQWLVTQS